uniref:Major facilitator superfamily (MFS) profile domain-containing protein n=1 Tax=Timema tahoe TaxID=61484 RepID=A0A7R9FMT0_9NEOP|nr:unnamed protein product [Timema tahoe]
MQARTTVSQVGMLYAGRFLTGMAGGAFSVSGPVYTAEVAQKEIRGLLGSFYQVLLTFGVLFTFAAGSVLSPFWLSAVCAAVPVLFAVTFVFMPETPVYFLRNDQGENARRSLRWLRGPLVDLEPELQELQLAVDEERKNQASLRDAFKTLGARKGLLVSAGLLIFQQLSGVNSATFYTTVIFKDAGSKMAPTQATIIIGAVQVVTTIVSCLVVDRLGRRILLLTSDLVMSLCMFALGTFFYLQHVGHDTSALTWLPVTSLSVFFVAYSLGYGPVPWLMMGELFLPNIKGIASSISCLLNWTLAFLVTKFFANLVAAFGTYTTFWIFAVLSAFGVLFVYFVVPETKGKPVDLIFREMNGDLVASPDFPLKNRDTGLSVQGMRGASAVYM